MTLFNNKYRIESTRLENWDYGTDAPYFITICTKNKEHFFGKVQDDEMTLNDIGIIAVNEWLQTPILRPTMNLILDEIVVMPNHFHAIICIGVNEFNKHSNTENIANRKKNAFMPQSNNIAAVIRGFKSSVTKQALNIHTGFGWQERFHDHIIRDHESYLRIKNYIINNPANWSKDQFYTK